MELHEYPGSIAKTQTELHHLETEITELVEDTKLIELEIDKQISFNTEYKNETQRKTARKDLLDKHSDYWEFIECLKRLKSKREELSIELVRLQGEFSVKKLLKREFVAKLEMVGAN
ncbi:MAG: hypothetical protein HC908_08985 [Calothrix sp. SM1_7_51]|nr:hypothetical protein [Calothrix sp. SM1_7_51]